MYNPLLPNDYFLVKAGDFEARRAKSAQQQQQKLSGAVAGGASLAAVLSTTGAGVSAEELREMRVRTSAALGVRRAVEMQKDALETDHKRRRLEGSDTRSHISALLGKMMVAPPSAASEVAPTPSSSSSGPSSTSEVSLTSASAPNTALHFVPSNLPTGGFVISAGGADTADAPSAQRPRGHPSSTLLVRVYKSHSPLAAVGADTLARLESDPDFAGVFLGGLVGRVRSDCGRVATVRSVALHVLTAQEVRRQRARVQTALESRGDSASARAAAVTAALTQERVRLLVRFDTVADALKAGEALVQQSQWSVCFFPTAAFDKGELGPSESEPLSL